MKLAIETDNREIIKIGDTVKINTSRQDDSIIGEVGEIFKSVWAPYPICIGIKGTGIICMEDIVSITQYEHVQIKPTSSNKTDNNIFDGDPMTKQECLELLCDEILGNDYYISDPVGVDQANTIITFEIIRKYKHKPITKRLVRLFK